MNSIVLFRRIFLSTVPFLVAQFSFAEPSNKKARLESIPIPAITELSPRYGIPGTQITIRGEGFVAQTQVTLNGGYNIGLIDCENIDIQSSTELTCIIPSIPHSTETGIFVWNDK